MILPIPEGCTELITLSIYSDPEGKKCVGCAVKATGTPEDITRLSSALVRILAQSLSRSVSEADLPDKYTFCAEVYQFFLKATIMGLALGTEKEDTGLLDGSYFRIQDHPGGSPS